MSEKEIIKEQNVEQIDKEKECKEKFEKTLENVRKISEFVELYKNVKEAVSKKEIDYNYLKYVENSLEDRLFNSTNIKGILPKIFFEIICPDLVNIEKFDENKIQIQDIGSHFEEQENYIDKICIYDNKLVSVFGINENKQEEAIKYEPRKFSRVDIIQEVERQYEEGKKVQLYQYDEYYVGVEEERIKVFSERKITALAKVEETIFDKIKSKFAKAFTKKRNYPNIELVYDSNPNRLKEFKQKSKIDAKSRMKLLLYKEREITRNINY